MPIRYTNRFAIPQPIADAIVSDTKATAGQYSVTQILSPPRIRRIVAQRDIEVDVTERLWAILGKSMHAIVEGHVDAANSEVQLVAEIDGALVSGTIDELDRECRAIRDWKMTSVYTGVDGRAEWVAQLNCYAWLCREARWLVDGKQLVDLTDADRFDAASLSATMIFRDWSLGRAMVQRDYPVSPVVDVPIEVWPADRAAAFVRARLDLHRESERYVWPNIPPLCTPEERWSRPDQFAVVKRGGKRAFRVFESRGDAEEMLLAKGDGYVIEHRPGVDVRCASYCTARSLCPHGIAVSQSQSQNQNENQETIQS